MLISMQWIRDFVDLPADSDPQELAERFTRRCAEVEEVFPIRKGDQTPAETVATSEDWIIRVDNKSITHRPDLWGHYGMAREIAAMLERPLKPLEIAAGDYLDDESLPEIAIEIDDPKACPRYSALMMDGFRPQASPDWMQSRLSHVGIRPINALVDLTNYCMVELGQPLHAFDGAKVECIEVALAQGAETFKTLDGVERAMPSGTIMIQSQRQNVAIAGIMGGLETEVTDSTTRVLLESATFDAATIRRAAAALGQRTEASARFEKSLDPANTVLAVARFVHLAQQQFPDLQLRSRLSDAFPNPPEVLRISVDPSYVSSFIGKPIKFSEMKTILEALEFTVQDHDDKVDVFVPSFRATKDIEGQADIIEEIARCVGYDSIEPVLPAVTMRHVEPNAERHLERRTLELFALCEGFNEIHDYVWFEDAWLQQLGYDPGPCIRFQNPTAAGSGRLRSTLVPSLLRTAELNRRDYPDLKIMTIGSVFDGTRDARDPRSVKDFQQRRLGLLVMKRGKGADQALMGEIKSGLAKWSRALFDCQVEFSTNHEATLPWQESAGCAGINALGQCLGYLTSIDAALRRRVSEHFGSWSVVVAEVDLTRASQLKPHGRRLRAVPPYPEVELDFSVLTDVEKSYADLVGRLQSFEHPLLKRLTCEGIYEGKGLPAGKRSLLLRSTIADAHRTLEDEDIKRFSEQFERFLAEQGLEIRKS